MWLRKTKPPPRRRVRLRQGDPPDIATFVIDPGYRIVNAWRLRWDAPREIAYSSTFVIDKSDIVRLAKVSDSHAGRPSSGEVLKSMKEIKGRTDGSCRARARNG